MAVARVSRRVRARGSTGRGPGAGGAVLLPDGFPVLAAGYGNPGANTLTWDLPVMVCLVAEVCGNFGRAFWARSLWRSRPGTFRVRSAALAAASAAAASAASDDDAVTWDDVMARIACWRAAVKDSSSAVTGAPSARRRARAAAASLRRAAAALARTSWVAAQPGPGFGDDQPRGACRRSTGPLVRFPAPVIVVLSSPNVVSDALHRVR